jgi:hypothetical protein
MTTIGPRRCVFARAAAPPALARISHGRGCGAGWRHVLGLGVEKQVEVALEIGRRIDSRPLSGIRCDATAAHPSNGPIVCGSLIGDANNGDVGHASATRLPSYFGEKSRS